MMGAGHKNNDNTFTGVIMGDYVKLDSGDTIQNSKTGLFGFENGNQTFELNTKGKVFIGKVDLVVLKLMEIIVLLNLQMEKV